ncbi:MAG: glycosyl hydrolase-related protein [Trueperaceae bacterium]
MSARAATLDDSRAVTSEHRRAANHTVTIVPHTHWDREWYQPFSVFQARLVETVDQVLDLLDEDPEFTHFMLDGQAVVLDDYLAVRPEAEGRISEFVRSGRLAIGPWYTLPDEFLSSPEALVRNLLIGGSTCRRFGEPMPVVYTPDSFGHVSQLPRLAHGFGFDSLVFERGVGNEGEQIGGEFRWSSADGKSSVLAVHLLTTYSSAAGIGYRDWSRYDGFDPHRAVAHAKKALYGGSERIGMEGWLDESLGRIQGGSSAYATGSNLLLLNGSDHLPPQKDLPKVIELLNEHIEGASFRLGRLREYIDGVLLEAGERDDSAGKLREFQGEFRGSRYHHVLSGVFSARIYLKQANHTAQQAVERYAEPLSVRAYLAGAPYPDSVLDWAWKELLRNHCHDSICGCSIDQVHDEMMPRFAGVMAGSRNLGRKALAHLTGGHWEVAPAPLIGDRLSPPMAGDRIAEDPAFLTVFNPHPRPWRGVLEALLPLPAGKRPPALLDSSGGTVWAELEHLQAPVPGDARKSEAQMRVRWLAELAPLSVTSYELSDVRSGEEQRRANGPSGGVIAGGVIAGDDTLENDRLLLECRPTGLVLTHKASGARMNVKLTLEDVADAGDEYDFSPLAGDEPLVKELHGLSLVGHATGAQSAEALSPESLSGALRISGELLLPERLSEDRLGREGRARAPFTVSARLEAGDPFVRLDVKLENGSQDHRLQLVAHCDIADDKVAVEGHFDVLERPIALPKAKGWFQTPSGTDHQRRFLAVGDGRRGLAILNAGLPEYSAQSTPDGTRLAVTLLRSVGWLSRNDLVSRPEGAGPALPTPGAQCLGEHNFELALMPFGGAWDEAGVPATADRFTAHPLVEATAAPASEHPAGHRPANDRPRHDDGAWLELPEGLLLSAVKKAATSNALIVRFWNPGKSRVDGPLRLARAPARVELVDFDEKTRRELRPTGEHLAEIPLSLDPKEIVSLAITFGGEAVR